MLEHIFLTRTKGEKSFSSIKNEKFFVNLVRVSSNLTKILNSIYALNHAQRITNLRRIKKVN
jgi:hypothetical protein